jgi:hypothetical protein
MASVANGNIQSFSILNESQLPDGSWGVTLKALVSVSKLTSFVEAKGIAIEIKGGLFALNIKQQLLNEQGEIQAISELVGLLHELMQISFDYEINSGTPISMDAESKNWEIPIVVKSRANLNIDICVNYLIKTLEAISLSAEEVKNYEGLNKSICKVYLVCNDDKRICDGGKTIYLRKRKSIDALKSLGNMWEFYNRLFTVYTGNDSSNGNGEIKIHEFIEDLSSDIRINFLTSTFVAATFSWNDKRTLAQIEKMTGYSIKPRGVVSQFKHGGFIVYEKNGHGLVAAITDLGEMDWESAKSACDELVLNGYSDWHLPTKEELNALYDIAKKNNWIYSHGYYWSSTPFNNETHWGQTFDFEHFGNNTLDLHNFEKFDVRAVRTF